MANQVLGKLLINLRANLSEFQSDMAKASNILKNEVATMGKHAAAIQLPIAAIGGYAMKAASEYKTAMREIRLGTGATGDTLKEFGKLAKEVYATTEESMQEIGTAMAELNRRTGLTGEPLKELTSTMLDLADVAGMDVRNAVQISTRLFGDWGIAANKQVEALDTLWRVSQVTGLQFGRMAETMTFYGAPLRQLGFNFEQTAVMLGKFEREGVNLELVVAGLRMSLRRFAEQGIDPSGAILKEIEKIRKASADAAMTLGRELVGARVAPDFVAAIREGRFDLESMFKLLRANADTISKADSDTRTFSDNLKILAHTVDVALMPLGEMLNQKFKKDFLPLMKDAADVVAGLGRAFMGLPDSVKNATLAIGSITAAVALGAPMLGMYLGSLVKLLNALKTLSIAAGGPMAAVGVLAMARSWTEFKTAVDLVTMSLGLLGKSILVVGVALAAYQITRWISQFEILGASIDKLVQKFYAWSGIAGLWNKGVTEQIQAEEHAALNLANTLRDKYGVEIERGTRSLGEWSDAMQKAAREHTRLSSAVGQKAAFSYVPSEADREMLQSFIKEMDEWIKKQNDLREAIDRGIASFHDQRRVTEEEMGIIRTLEKQGVPYAEIYEVIASKMDKVTKSADPLIEKMRLIHNSMKLGVEELPGPSPTLLKENEQIAKMIAAAAGRKPVELISAPIGTALDDTAGKKFAADVKSAVESFRNSGRDVAVAVAAVQQLTASGADLREVYEQYGHLLEKYPELLDKTTREALELGKAQSIINDGWLEIGRTIEKSLAGALSDMLSRARSLKDSLKGIWDSIKKSFTDMLGSMVSAFMMKFLNPMLTQIRTSGVSSSIAGAIPGMIYSGSSAYSGLGANGGYAAGALNIIPSGLSNMMGSGWYTGGSGATAAGAGLSGWASLASGGTFLGLGLGASIGSSLGGLFGGGSLGKALGMGTMGIGGAFGGAALAGLLSGGTVGAGALAPLLMALMGPAGWIVGAGVGLAALGNFLYKSPADRAAGEFKDQFGGVSAGSKTFEEFAASLGLSKSGYSGIRKDLLSSPKWLTEIAFPLAKQQGKLDEFLKSLEAVTTAWNPSGYNFRTAFESWMKTGNASALNKAFTEAFGVSQALSQNLPDWQNVLAASGSSSDTTGKQRLPINRPITPAPTILGQPIAPTSQPAVPQQIVFAPRISAIDGADVANVVRNKIFPEFLEMLKNNTYSSRQRLTQVLT